MKKRIVSILMALCLCLTLLPTAALADGETTEKVETEAALKSALVGTADIIQLTDNIQLTETICISRTVTLDLNGHALTGAAGSNGVSIGEVGGNGGTAITVQDGGNLTITGSGTISGGNGGNGYNVSEAGADDCPGYNGGNGGTAIAVNGGRLTITATGSITGGNGGKGGNGNSRSGNGGNGGDAITVSGSGQINTGNGSLTGGNGGDGGTNHYDSYYKSMGGNGGNGVSVTGDNVTIGGSGTISYGSGGSGGSKGVDGEAISHNGYHIVTFMNDDSIYVLEYVGSGKTAVAPATPEKEGHTLLGWYTEAGKAWNFDTDTVSEDITLYAKWDEGDGETTSALPFAWLIPGGLVGTTDLTDTTFVDVSHGAYYYNAVEWAYNRGIAGGVDAKHFAPDESCTRAQTVTMLYRAAGCPDIWGENPFVDVDASAYYYKAVLWAVANGITSGTDETHFSPDELCTRGQIVTFLHRAARCYVAHSNYGFTDVKTGAYCEDAINWAVETGITNGTSEGTFSPDDVCTRAQIVTFLYRNR